MLHKYLGIIQDMLTIDTRVKQRIIAEYRILMALQMIALNCYAIPVIRYSAGVINWTCAELDDVER